MLDSYAKGLKTWKFIVQKTHTLTLINSLTERKQVEKILDNNLF